MTRARWWIVAAALAWLAGCECGREGESESESESEGESESESEGESESESESEIESESESDCRLSGAPRVIGHESAARAVAIAGLEDGTPLVLADHDATHLDALLVAPGDGQVTPTSFEMPDASTLFAFEAAAPSHFVALTLGTCTVDDRATSCVHAIAIDTSSGHAVAHGLRTLPLPGPLRSSRVVAASDSLYFAHAHAGAAPALERFSAVDDELSIVTMPLGQGDPTLADEPTEILGLTASGGGYAVLWRRGASEDAASHVVLTTQLDEHQVAALQDALVVESMAWLAGSLSIVVSLEFARPSYVRIGADGEMRSPPSTLRFGEAPPAPFGGRRVALVRGEPGALAIQVRDGAGDDVGEAVALPASARRADAVRTSDGFLVVTADGTDGDRALTLRALRCP